MMDKTPQEPPRMEITKAEHQWLVRLGNEIKTQENAGTSDPVFCVQEKLFSGVRGYVTVQMFFTRKDADQYLEAFRHDMHTPRIYIASAYQNPQWKRLRAFFLKFADGEQLAADPNEPGTEKPDIKEALVAWHKMRRSKAYLDPGAAVTHDEPGVE